ncbi:Phosphomethylpyrimidine kinase THI21 (HMP-phosphate kinase) (HMP-P kinase) [Scheffersomyces stipitis CBS 6054]|uniref:Phosphomethylpyrimidine kinase THI21 (HMP-phosphate kinase) (HMP-P kinase) n=1 Tax=Scheffersomyces stipitis (strain ATCC 58785 / CBS 6054 / NBRC 10063 / NRRL Y-11545) TaxID=322104 RepID=A3LN87_PICST|nr:Phosphomethylpyrimidine kinase THI21 (HMP-phosphate kinase) (HMP-P kinase) [Scheffersomyces stipitis CBS 6054]ABN64815.1 Phosphomethylpyrimidine kinase THI21 (HMP-phosphate kinase) (HMP-P kinase) [Scheffersomyces stipitis CBS 6054]
MTTFSVVKLRTPTVKSKPVLPAVLTIAGSDNSGGAGIEADLKTFSAHKVYGLTCIAALTAQNTQLVKTFEKTPKELVKNILQLNFDDFLYGYEDSTQPLKVIKTGMLTEEAVHVIQDFLPDIKKHNVKLIVDPVMISTSGSSLFDSEGMKLCVNTLISGAYLITPNFVEARALWEIACGESAAIEKLTINSLDDFIDFVKQLQKTLKSQNVLVKGGHIPWDSRTGKPFVGTNLADVEDSIVVLDVLYESEIDKATVFESKYINTKDSHGTGCTLASAISANVAKGKNLKESISLSIDYIHKGMLSVGKKLGYGNGPLNHNVEPEENLSNVIIGNSTDTYMSVKKGNQSFFEYFKTHPSVKESWKLYTEHRFIQQLAQDKLPFQRFLYFLKQDYYYLINYAQMHGLAASVAPTYHQTHAEALIIGEVITEIEKHKEKLSKKYDIDYERDIDFDIELQPGKACVDYCNYLLEIGNRENFLGIKVALAPCLHGYAEAGLYGKSIRESYDKSTSSLDKVLSETYDTWLGDYSSEWYLNAHKEGEATLQELMESNDVSNERMDELVEIFRKVTELEVHFWDEVLDVLP